MTFRSYRNKSERWLSLTQLGNFEVALILTARNRFHPLDIATLRSGQQAAIGVDVIALMDASRSRPRC